MNSDENSVPPALGNTVQDNATILDTPATSATERQVISYLGDYELIREIARGGMGVVYQARQRTLNRTVAVKMILAGQLATETDVKRFRTEAEAAANLQHPNIVAIHEVGEHEGRQYFSMDYVKGKSLAEEVQSRRLDAREIAMMVKTIAEAVHYAHQRGTLHRDLKPQNILIDSDGRPRITDFGLAKRVDQNSELTRAGVVMGSPAYMPPEQAAGNHEQVGPASDVYSLGAILYQLLTGKPPFTSDSALGTLRLVIEKEPTAPSKLNPEVPPDLETICLKCLEKRVERRYSSARALAEELERFLNQVPILARPASGWRKAWSWSVRNPWAITGAGTLILLGTSGLAYGLWERLRHIEWQRTHTTPFPAESLLWGQINFVLVIIGLATAFHASCLAYIRRRKSLPISRAQVILGWIAGLSCMAFGLGAVRFVIEDFVTTNRPEEQALVKFCFKILISAGIAWAGALYFWHILRSQEVALFGSARSHREFRQVEVLNRKLLGLVTTINLLAFWLIARITLPERGNYEILPENPGFNVGLLRASFIQMAVIVWCFAMQSRGITFVWPRPGVVALVAIFVIAVTGMNCAVLPPVALLQATLAGTVGGLIQARLTRLKVTIRTEQTRPVQDELDSLFDLIHWNEKVLAMITGGIVALIIIASTGALNAVSDSSGAFLFLAAISTPCFPLLAAWRTAPAKLKAGLLTGAAVTGGGGLAIASNMVFNHGFPIQTAVAACATGWLCGIGILTILKRWRTAEVKLPT